MQPAAFAGTVGERVFVDRDERRNLCGIELHCDPARLTPAESGKAAAAGGNPG